VKIMKRSRQEHEKTQCCEAATIVCQQEARPAC
jgi:hypothetical protein